MTKNTESTGTTVGAVLLSGGLGIKLRLNVGGKVVVESADDTTSGASGAINTLGGLGVTKKAFVGTGLTIATGGATVTLGGLKVAAGGATVDAGGLKVLAAGLTVATGGIVVTDVVDGTSGADGAEWCPSAPIHAGRRAVFWNKNVLPTQSRLAVSVASNRLGVV